MFDAGCAGILVADTFCGPLRELPRAGQLLVMDEMPSVAGGCAANVAIGLIRQGLSASASGCVGMDPQAEIVLDALKKNRVDVTPIARTPDHPTSQTVILLVKGEDRRYLHVFGANRAYTCAHLRPEWLDALKVFYLGGFLALPGLEAKALGGLFRRCRERGIVTVLDVIVPPGVKGFGPLAELLPYTDYFLPNEDEAAAITGRSDPREQVRAILKQGARAAVVTRGEQGLLAGCGVDRWTCGASRMEVLDPSGSGDAFAAGLIAALRRGRELPEALAYASVVGASATRKLGCTEGVFTEPEAQEFLRAHPLSVKHERET